MINKNSRPIINWMQGISTDADIIITIMEQLVEEGAEREEAFILALDFVNKIAGDNNVN